MLTNIKMSLGRGMSNIAYIFRKVPSSGDKVPDIAVHIRKLVKFLQNIPKKIARIKFSLVP